MKEVKEIIDMGRRLDELSYEVYGHFAKREDFDRKLVALWAEMAAWKRGHAKHWKRIAKSFEYRNLFGRSAEDLSTVVRQMKNVQAELVEFLRRMKKKRVSQEEAISQTILNEFCLVSDIFLEIFYTYGETAEGSPENFVEECESHLVKMANTLKPYLRLNPLYAALLKSMVEIKHKYDFLLATYGKVRKAAG